MPAGAFTPDYAGPVLADLLQKLGLSGELRLLRWGENLTYHLEGSGLVVRLRRPTLPLEDTLAELAFAEYLADCSFPATRPAYHFPEPLETRSGYVTFWTYVSSRRAQPHEHELLGELLRRLHQLPQSGDVALRPWAPLGKIPRRLEAFRTDDAIPNWVVDTFEEQVADLTQALRHLEPDPRFGVRICHGDAYLGNVLVTPDGSALFCDLEGGCIAPAEWDVSETMTGKARFALPEEQWDAFVTAYGADPFSSLNAQLMLRLRELASTSWLLQQASTSRAIRDEGLMRVRSIRDDDYAATWSPF